MMQWLKAEIRTRRYKLTRIFPYATYVGHDKVVAMLPAASPIRVSRYPAFKK